MIKMMPAAASRAGAVVQMTIRRFTSRQERFELIAGEYHHDDHDHDHGNDDHEHDDHDEDNHGGDDGDNDQRIHLEAREIQANIW